MRSYRPCKAYTDFFHIRSILERGPFAVEFSTTLKKNHEFRRLYNKGKSGVSPWLAVYCRKNGRPGNRLGITVGTKVGKAVVRNRVRRKLREIYRLHEGELRPGYDIVVVARGRAAGAHYRELERSFLQLAKKLELARLPKEDKS